MFGDMTNKSKNNLDPKTDYKHKLHNGIVLIDDDQDFRNLLVAASKSMGVKLTAFESLGDMASFAQLKCYDVAIIDYYLNAFCGLEIAEYVDIFFRELPVVLVSASEIPPPPANKEWPSCIRKFVRKSAGPRAIIESGLDLLDSVRFYRLLQKRAVRVQ